MPVDPRMNCFGAADIRNIVLDRHRHRHFAGALLHHPEIPRLQPGPAVLGIRKRRKDAAIDHQPVVIEHAGLHAIGDADLGAIELFVAGRLVDDGKNPPAEFGHQRHLQITVLEHVRPECALDDGRLVEGTIDEAVVRIGHVFDGAPRHRLFAERHTVGLRRMCDGYEERPQP